MGIHGYWLFGRFILICAVVDTTSHSKLFSFSLRINAGDVALCPNLALNASKFGKIELSSHPGRRMPVKTKQHDTKCDKFHRKMKQEHTEDEPCQWSYGFRDTLKMGDYFMSIGKICILCTLLLPALVGCKSTSDWPNFSPLLGFL